MRTGPVVVLAALAGCASGATGDDPVVVVLVEGERGNSPFVDLAYEGGDAAATAFDISVEYVDVRNGNPLRAANSSGAELVVGVGFATGVTIDDADPTSLHLALVDAVAGSSDVRSYVFAAEQGSFLVGAAAALQSTSGEVGFIGGVLSENIQTFEAGFSAGVAHVDSSAEVGVAYLSLFPDFSGFECPSCAEDVATAMYEGGADVVYHASGASGEGLWTAVRAYSAANGHVWGIGVDTDEFEVVDANTRPHVLTSMIKRVDLAVYDAIEAHLDGSFSGGTVEMDLANEGVGYATSGGHLDDVADQLDALADEIVAGTISVPTVP